MWKDAALITLSAVLFIQMGLSEAIQSIVRVKLRILSCPKCLTFWLVLAWSVSCKHGAVECVAVPFLSAYSALWLSLVYDAMATLYNKAYDKISAQSETDQAGSDEMS